MTYKAIVTDLDGTAIMLSSMGDDISEDTASAVRQAIEEGKIITCATGRGWLYAKSVVRRLGIVHPCIVEGGTRIIDPVTEKTLWEKDMSDQAALFAKEIFKRYAANGLFVTSNRDAVNDDDGFELGEAQKKHFTTVEASTEMLASVRYLYLLGVTLDQAKQIVNAVNESSEVIAHTTRSWQGEELHDIHVTSRAATKEHAIKEWCEIMQLKKSEVVGCGDSGNDIPIFEAVGLRVAVENATDEILELADYIAPSPDNDGFAHIVRKFLL